jgi:16S rRNA (uracil1498-N3)-methyltransferase
LSLQPDARALAPGQGAVLTLSGPEGGLTPDEEAAARAAGFQPVALGPRVLRADTAPLAVLAALGLQA